MKRKDSIFWAMRDKSKKPDALGFQPLDPKIVAAMMALIPVRED